MHYTYLDLAYDVLKQLDHPLTFREIWQRAEHLGLQKQLRTVGRTPWSTLGAQLYTDVRDNPRSRFITIGKRPKRFAVKEQPIAYTRIPEQEVENEPPVEIDSDRGGYSVAQIHLREFISLPDVIRALAGLDTLYCELSFLAATIDERDSLAYLHPDSDAWASEVETTVGQQLWNIANHETFDPQLTIRNTDAEPRIVTAHPGGSWVVDLIGKLKPIEGINRLLIIVRDWKSERERRRLLNSKLGLELIRQEIANASQTLDLITKAGDLLKSAGHSDAEVKQFLAKRVDSITNGAVMSALGVKDIGMMSAPKYRLAIAQTDPTIQLNPYITQQSSRPSVWGVTNQMLPPPERQ